MGMNSILRLFDSIFHVKKKYRSECLCRLFLEIYK